MVILLKKCLNFCHSWDVAPGNIHIVVIWYYYSTSVAIVSSVQFTWLGFLNNNMVCSTVWERGTLCCRKHKNRPWRRAERQLVSTDETWATFMELLKAIGHFRNRKKIHRFTNNLQGLQRVMMKDFSWNIIPWNALLFEKTLKQLSILDIGNYGLILNTCHDTAQRAETRVSFPIIFSRLRWPIEPKFSQVCYFTYKLWYTKCRPLDDTVYW